MMHKWVEEQPWRVRTSQMCTGIFGSSVLLSLEWKVGYDGQKKNLASGRKTLWPRISKTLNMFICGSQREYH